MKISSRNIACLVCEERNSLKKALEIPQRKCAYFECVNCGGWILLPRPSKKELDKVYGNQTYFDCLAKPVSNPIVNSILKIKTYAPFEDYAASYVKQGKILDLGYGNGEFLIGMKKRGYKVYGIDPYSEPSKTLVREVGRKQLLKQSINKLPFPDNYFDAVTLWHVLEHLDSPNIVLREIRRVLKKGGKLFIELPNKNSALLKLFKNNYTWIIVPEHVAYYSDMSLKYLFSKNKFKPVKIGYPIKGSLNFIYSIKNTLDSFLHIQIPHIPLLFISPISVMFGTFCIIGKGEILRAVAEK